MDELITSDPEVLGGKPCVAGTRLAVAFILELLAGGASREEVLEAYPQLTEEGLAAALHYAAERVGAEVVWERKVPA